MEADYAIRFFDDEGQRLFLSPDEYDAFVSYLETQPTEKLSICHLLAHTGCRLVEALALRPEDLDLSGDAILFGVNEKCGVRAVRSVPVPHHVLVFLQTVSDIRALTCKLQKQGYTESLWSYEPNTASRKVMKAMKDAGISGPQASSRGLRYGYAVKQILQGYPIPSVVHWMGQPEMACATYQQLFDNPSWKD